MAASTITIDTDEWSYVDSTGVGHTVTNGQTFSMTVVDGGTAAVKYAIPVAQSVTTTDGYNVNIRPNANGDNAHRSIHFLTDAAEGSDLRFPAVNGELVMDIDNGANVQQIWRIQTIQPSDADFGSAGTMGWKLEDQFGNTMTWTGVTVGQAA